MDRIVETDEFEPEIAETMREEGVDRDEAQVIVGLRRGELFGDGDLLSIRPLSPDQKRQLGLGRSIDDMLAAQRPRTDR
jgi:hypothetical protein